MLDCILAERAAAREREQRCLAGRERDRRVFAPRPRRVWLTTRDAAKQLGVTPRWVRDLVRMERLAYDQTRSGTLLFQEADVLRLVTERAKARAESRAERLASVRTRMLRAHLAPRQPRFRLVG